MRDDACSRRWTEAISDGGNYSVSVTNISTLSLVSLSFSCHCLRRRKQCYCFSVTINLTVRKYWFVQSPDKKSAVSFKLRELFLRKYEKVFWFISWFLSVKDFSSFLIFFFVTIRWLFTFVSRQMMKWRLSMLQTRKILDTQRCVICRL